MTREEEYEETTALVRFVAEHHPIGHERFDLAWTIVRAERAHRAPEDCLMTRLLVRQFRDILATLQRQAALAAEGVTEGVTEGAAEPTAATPTAATP